MHVSKSRILHYTNIADHCRMEQWSVVIMDIFPKRILNSSLGKYLGSKFCIGLGSITAVPCVNFPNDLTTEMDIRDERNLPRSQFKMRFWWIAHITTASRSLDMGTNVEWEIVNPRHQTPTGQGVRMPATPLDNSFVGFVNSIQREPIARLILYSQRGKHPWKVNKSTKIYTLQT